MRLPAIPAAWFGCLLGCSTLLAATDSNPSVPVTLPSEREKTVAAEADRMSEMYLKMRHAVEEVAELYGSPRFVQIFTNDKALADELRLRLRATDAIKVLNAEAEELSRRCQRLKAEVAKQEADAAVANQRLVKQRAAMAAVESAVEQANRAVEGTVP